MNRSVSIRTFQQAKTGIYEESIIIENNAISECKYRLQLGQADFADGWLRNVVAQGFLLRVGKNDRNKD